MIRRDVVAVVILLAVAACGEPSGGVAETRGATTFPATADLSATSISTTPSTTPAPSTATTTSPVPTPQYLTFGWDGVTRFQGGTSEQLVVEPVAWADQDGAGGIVFRSVTEHPGWVWLAAGAARPLRIELDGESWSEIRLVFAKEGRPSVLVARGFEAMSQCDPGEFVGELAIVDLTTGTEQFLMCRVEAGDGAESFTSFGGGLLASVSSISAGTGGTHRSLSFYDLDGREVSLAHNPVADSCEPCRLSAKLSPDGTALAYAVWPTAYWKQPPPATGDIGRAHAEWREQQKDIPTEVAVIELATGIELLRTDLEADWQVDAFDGRYLTLSGDTSRQILDIGTNRVIEIPSAESGAGGFWTVVLASLVNSATDYNAAQEAAGAHAADLDVITGVLWSDGLLTLNPGYWAVFTGHFSDRNAAIALCDALPTDCYARYVAAIATGDPQLARGMLILEPEGLGLVRFGQPEAEVMAVMERLMGSPPTAGGEQADWVEYVGWEGLGLFLGFSRPMWTEYDGVSRFVGWQHHGGAELDLRTAAGVSVGTTVDELSTLYGPDLVVPLEPDECLGRVVQLLGSDAGILVLLNEANVVRVIEAGVGVGC